MSTRQKDTKARLSVLVSLLLIAGIAVASVPTQASTEPQSGTVIASFPSPGPSPTGLAWDGQYLWNADEDTDIIYELNPSTGSVITSFASPGSGPYGLAWDGQYVWNADGNTDTIYKIDVGSSPTGVEGTVYYSTTPLSGVKVALSETGSGYDVIPSTITYTDNYGWYTILYDKPGEYFVIGYAPSPEYIDWKGSSVSISAGQVVERSLDLPKKMTLLEPPNGATIQDLTPTLTWQANPEAIRYTLQVNIQSTWELVLHERNITSTGYTFQDPLSEGIIYAWQVDADDPANHHVGTTHDAFTLSITVGPLNQPPTASFTYSPESPVVGEEITFDASSSTDPDGQIVSYEWDFGDSATGSGVTTAHAYTAAREYIVTLTVVDNDGATGTDTAIVTVQTPTEATQDLADAVEKLDLPEETEDSLTDKLEAAIDSLNRGRDNAAMNQLWAFINQVEALRRSGRLTVEEADALIAIAQRIIDSIGGGYGEAQEQKQAIQRKFGLSQNYPNPFNPETTIEYDIDKDCEVVLKIYNLSGQLIRILVDEFQTAGQYTITWYGDNDAGQEIASGVYFYRLQAGDEAAMKKMVVLK